VKAEALQHPNANAICVVDTRCIFLNNKRHPLKMGWWWEKL